MHHFLLITLVPGWYHSYRLGWGMPLPALVVPGSGTPGRRGVLLLHKFPYRFLDLHYAFLPHPHCTTCLGPPPPGVCGDYIPFYLMEGPLWGIPRHCLYHRVYRNSLRYHFHDTGACMGGVCSLPGKEGGLPASRAHLRHRAPGRGDGFRLLPASGVEALGTGGAAWEA